MYSAEYGILEGLKADDVSPLLGKCRHLVGHFKHGAANTAELKASHICVQKDSREPFHKLQQDVTTRWNGTYLMMVRLLAVKEAVKQHHIDPSRHYSRLELLDAD